MHKGAADGWEHPGNVKSGHSVREKSDQPASLVHRSSESSRETSSWNQTVQPQPSFMLTDIVTSADGAKDRGDASQGLLGDVITAHLIP